MRIGQKYYVSVPEIVEGTEYTDNLVAGESIISLNIYACPGSLFKINDNSDIIMNGTGNFSLNCEEFPITSLKIHKNNLIGTIPTIIDYVSEGN